MPRAAPHLTLTRHAFDTGMYLANKAWFEGLSRSQQAHLRNSLMPVAQFRELVRSYESNILRDAERYGISLHEPDAATLSQWQTATAKNQARLADTIGGDSQRIAKLLVEANANYHAAEKIPGLL